MHVLMSLGGKQTHTYRGHACANRQIGGVMKAAPKGLR